MSKKKKKKNECDKLRANVKKMKEEWQEAEVTEAKARKKYRKEYAKFKELLVPFKANWKKAKSKSDQRKKKYKTTKQDFATKCQPKLMGEVMVVWKAPNSATAVVADNRAAAKTKVSAKPKTVKAKTKVAKKKAVTTTAKSTSTIPKPLTPTTPVSVNISKKTTPLKVEKATKATASIHPSKGVKPPAKKTTGVAKAAAQTPKKAATDKQKGGKDDLKKVEGIGPKIEQLLNAANIRTFKNLAEAKLEKLQGVLTIAGARFRMHKPDTWPRQAEIAAKGGWEELKAWQEKLKGGKE